MENHGVFFNAFIYLLAAVIAVPLSKRLGLGSVIGYLIAGVTIGPWGLGIIGDVDDILHFAEFGVVLLLFLIGLELNPGRLWAMHKPILGLGGAQVLASTLLITGVGTLAGLDWENALIAGMGLSLSSTALALQLLTEKNLLPTPAGNAGVSILLFQDLAVIPMLTVIPLLGDTATASGMATNWLGFVKIIAVIAGIVIGGRYLLRPVFRVIAGTRLREIFTAFSLLLVIGIALLMQAVDMSMALGTFLAGVLLAESEYRHALESDIEPFKGLLLGLFFIAVGMSVDFGLLLERPVFILTLVAGLIFLKLAVLFALARMFKLPLNQHALFAFLLSQGGEFAFVLFGVATTAGVFKVEVSELLIVVVALSMMTTPLLMILNQIFFESRFKQKEERPMDVIESQSNPVIIAGFGRFGQIVARLLHANGVDTTILDHDPEHIEMIRKFGFKVFYGDASRLDLLHAAGAEHARLLVLAVDDREQALEIVDIVHDHFPNLSILTRAWDVLHAFELLEKGVLDIERETFEGALRLGEQALKRVGFGAWQAKLAAHKFRAHDQELFTELYKHFRDDLEVRVTISASARARLQEQMEADEAFFGDHRDADWR
jgi:glutathione-regulated potassium-efflux system ancillary protein KefC